MRLHHSAFSRRSITLGERAAVVATLALTSCTPRGLEPPADCPGGACVQVTECKLGQASAQFRDQQAPPSLVTPRSRVSVSLSFANCSGQTWRRDDFALRPARGVDPSTWGVTRVALPVDVPDGHQISLPFEVTAPADSGAFTFSFAIAHDGIEVFEEASPKVAVRVAEIADCTAAGPKVRFRAQVPPPGFVATGAPVHASVTFANCSPDTWTAKDGVALGSRSAPDDTWGPRSVPLPFDVPPSREVTIAIDGVAPAHPGRYDFAWQLAQNGAWLDEAAPPVTSIVLDGIDCSAAGPPARFLSQHVPASMVRGDTADVSARFGNCGRETWGSGYVLDSALPGKERLWGAGPVALALPVATGFAIDIPFQIHAPGNAGTYPYRFGITTRDGTLLDEPSPPLDIEVRCVPSCGDHDCGGDGCGGSCGGCQQDWSCDGAHCQPPVHKLPSCGNVQWWNTYLTGESIDYGWHDTDSGVRSSTPVQLRHDSQLYKTGVYGWGYMPEFVDLATGFKFRFLHLRPQQQNATNVGQVYPAGYIVGISGGDTFDTGLPKYSTGAHLCVQTLVPYRQAFPQGQDPCQ